MDWKYNGFCPSVCGGFLRTLSETADSVQDIFEKNGYDSDSFPLLPEYVMDCGEDDLICGEFNRVTEEYLKSIKFPHVYRTFPGGHDWDYWSPAYHQCIFVQSSLAPTHSLESILPLMLC